MAKKSGKLSSWFRSRPGTSGVIIFVLLSLFITLIINQRYRLFKESRDRELYVILDGVRENINQSLKNSYTISITLALTINDQGIPKNFDKVAAEMLKSNKGVKSLQLVPNGVVKYVYPIKGNEGVLNLDLFKRDESKVREIQQSINTRQLYFEGPVKLKQGGLGVIGRFPIFINNKFWGFSAVVIELDTLFKVAGIDNNRYTDYQFQFSKINKSTGKEDFFLPMPTDFGKSRSQSISFPEGDWKVYIVDVTRYDLWFQLIATLCFGLGTAVLTSYLLTRLLRKQNELQEMIKSQASKILDTETKFENIFDHAPIGIARIDSKTGRILEANPYFCNFLDYTKDELFLKKIKSIIYPDDIGDDGIIFKKLLSGEIRKFNKEKRYVTKQGKVTWGELTITPLWDEGEDPTNHIVIIEDITRRKEEEQALVSSQQRLESLINTIDGIVWEGNVEDETYSFVSAKVTDLLGYTPKQWTSIPNFFFDNLHPEDRAEVELFTMKALSEQGQRSFEYRMIAADGSVVWIRDILTITVKEGRTTKISGIMIDITDQIKTSNDLKTSFNLVTEQNKRLLNFSYIVSHNLRSHSSNISGIANLIESAKNEGDRLEMIQLLKTVSDNLNETLYNLNNVVNIQTSIDILIESLNLRTYITNAVHTQNTHILAKKAIISIDVETGTLVHYNRAYLDSVLLNLISNALRYCHPDRQPEISFSCYKEDGKLVMAVADNGIGIDLTKHYSKLFGIYQTFNGNADARGFGLFITKNQIEAMGGRIDVESEINVGTTFKIYFK